MGGLASGITDLFGGAQNNADFNAQQANLIQPVDQGQIGNAQSTNLDAIAQQQALVQALNAQNGLANQNQVYGQAQNLYNQIGSLAQGQGPNPALAQLNQTTGQNIASQAALQAGQRGINQNVGLAARNIGMQGAATQQQAVGQGATMQAQQQLAALQAQQAQQAQLAGIANQQVAQQIGATQGYGQAAQGNQNSLLQSLQGYNSNQVENMAQANKSNEGIAAENASNTGKTIGGLFSGAAAATKFGAPAPGATGGEVHKDHIGSNPRTLLEKAANQRILPAHLHPIAEIYHPKLKKMYGGGMAEGAVVPGNPKVPGKNTEKNDVVPALLTPKEIVLPLSVTQSDNPGEAAKEFVEGIKGKKSPSDFKKALREHVKNRKNKKR